MAKLDPAFLEEGRRHVRQGNLDGLMEWVERSGTFIDHDGTREAFRTCFRSGDTDKAMALFNEVFPKRDPAIEKAVIFARLAAVGVILLALLGGFMFLMSVLLR